MTYWEECSCLLVSVKTDTPLSSSAVIVTRLRLGKGEGACQMDDTCSCMWTNPSGRQTDRQTLRGKPSWCEISTMASPRRSKVTSMMTRFLLQASPGLRGRHVFLIEPQWSKGSLILISGDRNPIFRGDSWESGSPRVREMTVSL